MTQYGFCDLVCEILRARCLTLRYDEIGEIFDVPTLLDKPKQAETAHRLSQLAPTDATIINQLSQTLSQQVRTVSGRSLGGISALSDVLNTVQKRTEDTILAVLQAQDPELAEKVRAELFTFEDLQTVADQSF